MFDLLDKFVANLVNGQPLQPMYIDNLDEIVAIHKPLFHCGFRGDMFERFGELLVDMLVMDEFVQVCRNVQCSTN